MMKSFVTAIAAGVMAGALMMAGHASATPSKMQACAAQWQQMKASGQDKGTTYKAFSSSCMKGSATPAPAAPAVTAPAPKPAKVTKTKTVAVVTAPVVPVAAKGQTKMQVCAANWQSLKASGKTNGMDYKTYSSSCMKGTTVAMAPSVAAVAKPAATVANVTPMGGKMSQQNRMKACAAQWDQMKAQNKTNGMTYKAFSSQCLKTH